MVFKETVFFLLLILFLEMTTPGVLGGTAEDDAIDPDCPLGCPDGWSRFADECYYIKDTPTQNQGEARSICQSMGADLPIITSDEENNFIHSLMKSQNTVTKWGAWIGMERKADGKFYWFNGIAVEGKYTKWDGGEPNDAGGNEDCVNLYGVTHSYRDSHWNDFSCVLGSHVTDAPVVACQKSII